MCHAGQHSVRGGFIPPFVKKAVEGPGDGPVSALSARTLELLAGALSSPHTDLSSLSNVQTAAAGCEMHTCQCAKHGQLRSTCHRHCDDRRYARRSA